MRKIILTVAAIVVALIAGLLAISIYEADTKITDGRTKVGVILNGTRDDKSWSQSHYEGIEKTAQELNLETLYTENVSTDTINSVIKGYVNDGCEIIIANSASFSDYIIKAVEVYPEIYFFHATGVSGGKNLATYFGRMYQMRYLTGIVAGLQTETNEIGYVAAFPIPEVNRGINAFTLGVRSVNPDAKVYVRWINSWTADDAVKSTTEQLLQEHDIDILAMHTDSLVPVHIADEKGIMSIGYNLDNSADYPDSYLTAAVWDWEQFYTPHIQKCLQGKFVGGNYWESVNTGIVNIAPLSDRVNAETAEILKAEYEKLCSGTYDVFYGPVTDNNGVVRIAEGESMTDNAMLNEFYWYVEGVVIDEE